MNSDKFSADERGALAIIGAGFGDEGKGKIVDHLVCAAAEKGRQVHVARAGGGANAGHTIVAHGKKFVFHLLPSGALEPRCQLALGNGCVVSLASLEEEIETAAQAGIEISPSRLVLCARAHLVFGFHKGADRAAEARRKHGQKIGTTLRGIGPAYSDRAARVGLRAGELLRDDFPQKVRQLGQLHLDAGHISAEELEQEVQEAGRLASRFAPFVGDASATLRGALAAGGRVILEGAQGAHLDLDMGTYPFVTSSLTGSAGALAGVGLPPLALGGVLGVIKAYTTRVGEGPLVGEMQDETAEALRQKGGEFGATTGRPRRVAPFDAVLARSSARVHGITAWNLTKLDVLTGEKTVQLISAYRCAHTGKVFEEVPADAQLLAQLEPITQEMPGWDTDISGARKMEELPTQAADFLRAVEHQTQTPIHSVGVGAGREALIFC